MRVILTLLACIFLASAGRAADAYHEVKYPPSDKPGELIFGVTYTVWIPDGVKELRGVIVHQHGCGSGACKGGETAAYDLHWQALARKWNCALLGPSFQQEDKQDCRKWCDPRNGSEKAFLRALADLAKSSGHPELATAPWCLWGHSGGGFWASIMQTLHPDRIVAIWCRSGTAFTAWEKGEIPKPEISAAAYAVPVMLNPGGKEKGDARFAGAWTGSMAMLAAYRAKGAPIGFAPDPRTSHECGDSRYLAIPFFDACLAARLPDKGAKPIEVKAGVFALPESTEYSKAVEKPEAAGWLPNEAFAKLWVEYVKTGSTPDTTPPPSPTHVKVKDSVVSWEAKADFESGLRGFIILRDGKELAQHPAKPVGRFGRPLFQTMSYHDTPEKPLPAMSFTDTTAKPGEKYEYQVIAVNSVGLKSEPTRVSELRGKKRLAEKLPGIVIE
jgi:poly(3-hydroxybutyrate) depolymerase